jgi:hypothetical protein
MYDTLGREKVVQKTNVFLEYRSTPHLHTVPICLLVNKVVDGSKKKEGIPDYVTELRFVGA